MNAPTARPVRPGGYSFEKQQARRNKRREEAKDRQRRYERLTARASLAEKAGLQSAVYAAVTGGRS